MRELETQYADRAEFVVVPAAETQARGDEIAAFGFTELKHGLVVFDGQGEAQTKIPGHQFGVEEIEAALRAVL